MKCGDNFEAATSGLGETGGGLDEHSATGRLSEFADLSGTHILWYLCMQRPPLVPTEQQSCVEIDFDSNRLPCINFLCFFFFLLLEVAVGELFVLRH